jgi:hypothetical protein
MEKIVVEKKVIASLITTAMTIADFYFRVNPKNQRIEMNASFINSEVNDAMWSKNCVSNVDQFLGYSEKVLSELAEFDNIAIEYNQLDIICELMCLVIFKEGFLHRYPNRSDITECLSIKNYDELRRLSEFETASDPDKPGVFISDDRLNVNLKLPKSDAINYYYGIIRLVRALYGFDGNIPSEISSLRQIYSQINDNLN